MHTYVMAVPRLRGLCASRASPDDLSGYCTSPLPSGSVRRQCLALRQQRLDPVVCVVVQLKPKLCATAMLQPGAVCGRNSLLGVLAQGICAAEGALFQGLCGSGDLLWG